MEDAPRRWQGIESIFEAYQEYMDGEISLLRGFVCNEMRMAGKFL